MPQFSYKAFQASGAIAAGRIEANNRQEAFRLLEGRGLNPLRLEEAGAGGEGASQGLGSWGAGLRRRRISGRALETFTRQLASLLAAGVALSRALRILSKESASSAAAAKWKEIHDLVADGSSLADAMARSPEVFPRVYTAMVRAGETGGFLDVVLGQIADFQAREKDLKSKVVSALVYPALLLALAFGVLIFLLTFFIPRFEGIFKDFGASLPALTRCIVATSKALTRYGLFIVIALVVIVFTVRGWLRSEQGRREWQQLVLRMPVIGALNARFALTRFCRMLGTLAGAGVPLIVALRVARESLGNQTLVDTVTGSIERVQKGDSLAASLADCPSLFPGSALEMIAVAEETGQLDRELVRLAAVTEGDLERQLKMAVALAEPLLLFLMAAFIGTIFVGMVIPIFAIQDYIK